MANAKISELIQRAPDGTEFLEVIIPPFGPGSNRRVLLQDIVDLAAGGGGTVTSVTGTTNRVTSTGGSTPVIDIDPAYDTAVTNAINAKVADAINDGTTTVAPSQNAVFDALALKAPLASPALTGTPTAPTAAAATKTTQLATTAFVLTEMPYWVAGSDEVTPITASDRITFPWPFPGTTTLVNVIGFLATPQVSGSIFTIDIEKNGTTILSTLLTIDNTQYDSSTAATPVVISVPSIAFLNRITIVVTQIGDNTAKGLKLGFIR